MSKEVFLLYANCIPVKGAHKCALLDLQRSNYFYIPMDLYSILVEHKGKSVSEVKAFYESKYDDIIDNYFKVLWEKEYIFFTDTPDLFPELKKEWKEPFDITNAVIDVDDCSEYDIKTVLEQLSELNCKFIQIRYYNTVSTDALKYIFGLLDEIESNSIGIDISLPYNENLIENDCIDLFSKYRRLNNLIVHSSSLGKRVQSVDSSRYYIRTNVKIRSEKDCGVINKALFSVNIKTYTESLKYNSCLNGKISIDKHGDIKNCPAMKRSFGNISHTKLQDALSDSYFREYWSITKDTIDECKDCELRYICTDCRAFLTNPSNLKSKPLKCGYDPYRGEWNDCRSQEAEHQSSSTSLS